MQFRFLLIGSAAFLLFFLPCGANAQNGSIGLYADIDATQNFATFEDFVPKALYIIATLEGQTADGTIGAEFRVVGLPDGWTYSLAPNPAANISLGDPFASNSSVWRANLAFPSCQTGTSAHVLLYTVTVTRTSEVTNQFLTVAAGSPPTNLSRDYPLLTLCDMPVFSAVQIEGRPFLINPDGGQIDFSISTCDISVSNTSPAAGQQVSFEAVVHNSGLLDALVPVPVRFLLDGIPVGPDVLAGPIPSMGTALVTSAAWPADFDPHQLTVVVDPDSVLDEGSFANNSANGALPYDLSLIPIPACSQQPPSMFSDCEPCPGDVIDIQAVVRNTGLFTADSVWVEFQDVTNGTAPEGQVIIESLQGQQDCSGDATSVSIPRLVTTGSQSYRVVVDPENKVPELDENNNAYTQGFVVLCSPAIWFDYEILPCRISVSNTSPTAGEDILFQVTVHNVGALNASEPTSVRFLLDGVPFGNDVATGPILSSGSVTVSASMPWTVDFAPHILWVKVNPDTTQIEHSYTNNLAGLAFPYELGLETVVTCEAFDSSDCVPCLGDTIALEAYVRNTGAFDVGSVEVSFADLLPVEVDLGTFVVHNVGSRTNCSPSLTPDIVVAFPVKLGLNLLSSIVDPNNNWPELNEDGNQSLAYINVECIAGPDLAILSHEIYPAAYNVEPGGILDSVTVVVHNFGRQTASDVVALLTIDAPSLVLGLLVGDIPAGGQLSATFETNWVAPNPPPFEHQLIVCADPADLVAEVDEDNNCGSLLLNSGGSTPVALTDLLVSSTADGVHITWKALDGFPQLGVDRRTSENSFWERRITLPSREATADKYATYSHLDTEVLPGVLYDYRIIGLERAGTTQVLGELSVSFTPPTPNELVLYPNYPNPFNPTTQIRLSIPRQQNVRVRIVDSSGRFVVQLWNGPLESGYRTVAWHGKNSQGLVSPSGIYFCNVLAEDGRRTQKLVLLK